MKRAIVNADDFGHSAPVNAGIVEAFERGIVTSTSLMVLRPAIDEAVEYARAHPDLGVGLHVELGEWVFRGGEWEAIEEVPEQEVAGAIADQLVRFRALLGEPTHLDSHQHVHLREPARSLLAALGRELGLHVRHLDARTRYLGDFYGQTETGEPLPGAIETDALVRLLGSLPEGTTELCCHPGKGAIPGSSYGPERERELRALCDPSVRAAVEAAGIELVTFRELG